MSGWSRDGIEARSRGNVSDRTFDEAERKRVEHVIAALVGPSPWYIRTFPLSHIGANASWAEPGSPTGAAVLKRDGPVAQRAILAIPMYARPLLVGELLLCWIERGDLFYAELYDPSALSGLGEHVLSSDPASASWSATPPIASVQMPARLAAGRHSAPRCPRAGDREVFMIARGDRDQQDDEPAASIHIWRPAAGVVEVLPQRWFRADRYDLGYQWITRVGRDPVSARLVGDGIRIGPFELDPTGTELADFRGWFGWEWRRGTGPRGAEGGS